MVEEKNGGNSVESSEINCDSEKSGKSTQKADSEHARNVLAFFLFGFSGQFSFHIILAAAKSLMGDTKTALVFIVLSATTFIFKSVAPFYLNLLHPKVKVVGTALFCGASFLVVTFCDHIALLLFGVALGGIGSGLAEMTSLALCASYSKSAVEAMSSGTGFVGVSGSGWYYLFSKVVFTGAMSAKYSLLTAIGFPFIFVISYAFVLTDPKSKFSEKTSSSSQKREAVVEIEMTGTSEDTKKLQNNETLAESSDSELVIDLSHSKELIPEEPLTTKEKFQAIWSLKLYILVLIVTYFFTYGTVSGILPARRDASPDDDFSDETFKTGYLIYRVGIFISRSLTHWLPIPYLLGFPIVQGITLALVLIDAFTQFMPLWCLYIFMGWLGAVSGAVYSNTLVQMRKNIDERIREFALTCGSTFVTSGQVFGGVFGLVFGILFKASQK